ncbi:MAG: hypothetical protein ACRCZP_11530 [Phycicoccus sp.]
MISVPKPRAKPPVEDDLVFAGAVIRQALREAGVDIKHAALRMSVGRRTLHRILNGDVRGMHSTLARVEHFLRWCPGTVDLVAARDYERITDQQIRAMMSLVEHRQQVSASRIA